MPRQRIQKLLAAAGYGSRRACEELVTRGRVAVNERTVTTLPVLVDTTVDLVTVDGRPVATESPVYYVLNKPSGVFCTQNEIAGRARAVDLLNGVRERVYPVGRLEAETMGLLLLTNDGELTQRLTHPRYRIPKTYRVEVSGAPTRAALESLRAGVWLSEGRSSPARIEVIHSNKKRTILDVTVADHHHRELRRMLAKIGHNVRRMTRIRIGRLSIEKLPLGAYRPLTTGEIKYLKSLTAEETRRVPPPSRASPRPTNRPRRVAGVRPSAAAPRPTKKRRRIVTS